MLQTQNDPFPHRVTLKDGSEILVRKTQPEDSRLLFLMFNSLTPDTMFRRFLMSPRRLTVADIEDLLGLSEGNVTSLIAILREGDKEQAVGEARYVTDSGVTVAEVAILVAD